MTVAIGLVVSSSYSYECIRILLALLPPLAGRLRTLSSILSLLSAVYPQ